MLYPYETAKGPSNYYEGLNDFDVHLTSYSARTGVASTQRETRNAGYATRKVIYMTDGTKIVAGDCGKQDWWYDAIWDDRIDSAGRFYPSSDWCSLNLLGRSVGGHEIAEEDFGKFIAEGFNSIEFDDGKEPASFHADPYILLGSRLVDEIGEKYFGRLIDQDRKFNSACADTFDKYKIKDFSTTFGRLVCRYKLYGSCRSQLMYREARDLKFLKSFYNYATDESVDVITEETLDWIEQEGVDKIPARVMLDCECKNGICAHCYGLKYSNLQLPEVGEIVGTESAQAIGEPSAQLTMNVINKGGVAGASIASGIDVFNAYLNGSVAGGSKSELADVPERSGHVHIVKMDDTVSVCVEPIDKQCAMCAACLRKNHLKDCPLHLNLKEADIHCMVPHRIRQSALVVRDGEWIESGYPLTSYPLVSDLVKTVKDSADARQVLRHKQMIWINNYYNIFRDQSISINVRHFELLAMIQNQYVTVAASDNPKYKVGEVYNVSEVDLDSTDVDFYMQTASMNEVILRNSGLLAALTFAGQMEVISKAASSHFRSKFNESSPVGLLTVGQDLSSNEMKVLTNNTIVAYQGTDSDAKDTNGIELVAIEEPGIGLQLNELELFDTESFDIPSVSSDTGGTDSAAQLSEASVPDVKADMISAETLTDNSSFMDVFNVPSAEKDAEDAGQSAEAIEGINVDKEDFSQSTVDIVINYYFDGKADISLQETISVVPGESIAIEKDSFEGYHLVGNGSVVIDEYMEQVDFYFESNKALGGHEVNMDSMSLF